jgi:hypothetical protein
MVGKLVVVAFLCISHLYAQTLSSAMDSFKSPQFLLGNWEAKTRGGSAGAASSGTYSFGLELRDHVLARHTSKKGCKGPADFDCEHGDLLYVYRELTGRPLKAIYFDNEGHVIHYDVSVPSPTTAVQSSPADSQTLQAILEEIRDLRQDLQNVTVTARRTEIFLYRLQTQETVVARAFQRVAEAQSKLGEVQSNRNKLLTTTIISSTKNCWNALKIPTRVKNQKT